MFLSLSEEIEESLDKDVSECEEFESAESLPETKDSFLAFFVEDLPDVYIPCSLNE